MLTSQGTMQFKSSCHVFGDTGCVDDATAVGAYRGLFWKAFCRKLLI